MTQQEWQGLEFFRFFIIGPGYWARGQSIDECIKFLRQQGYRRKTGLKIYEFDDQIRGQHFDGWGCAYFLNPDLTDTPEEYSKHRKITET
jgi:hypothetical protein